ncbi:nose resistant to fluoxetine protein 6-like [Zophobas morio]|uniref:nose resistant to fluoxetine protein 6-like n=1 Tax=Zophobas morio TaxID=2755281 RepID=UPI0030831661
MQLRSIFLIAAIFLSHNPYAESKFFKPKTLLNFFVQPMIHVVNSSLNGTKCAEDLRKIVSGVYNMEIWAMEMLDASSKFDMGLLTGNTKLYGNYDLCISVQNNVKGSAVDGQYCTIPFTLDDYLKKDLYNAVAIYQKNKPHESVIIDQMTYYYGLCIPTSCTLPNVAKIWSKLKILLHLPAQTKFQESQCYTKDRKIQPSKIDPYIFTIYDVYIRSKKKEPNIFVCASWYTNTKKLLSTHCENDTLKCLYGVKVISSVWIIVTHLAITKVHFSVNPLYAAFEWLHRVENSVFSATPFAVDTFFSISGMLVVVVGLKVFDMRPVHWALLYMHRILRIGPALLAIIAVNVTFVKYMVEGPYVVHILHELKTQCENNWWTTLFFVNNFVRNSERCVPHTWYLSIDTQLYLATPLLIYCLRKKPKLTFLGITLICILSMLYTWHVVVKNNYGFIMYWDVGVEGIYFSTISRLPAWFVGTFFGYVLYRDSHKKIRISKQVNSALWALVLSTIVALVFYHKISFQGEYKEYISAFYHTFCRLFWCLSVCYIILSCCTGHSKLVDSFLSHPVFIVMGKLTYSLYLVHLTVIFVVMAHRKHLGYFSSFEIWFEFCGHFMIMLISATLLFLVFEAPVFSFLKLKTRKYSNQNYKKVT